jgi:hypothetical protein
MKRSRQINFRCPDDVAQLFERTAKAAGLSLSTWLIVVGLEAAGHGELRPQLERVAKAPLKRKAAAKRAAKNASGGAAPKRPR